MLIEADARETGGMDQALLEYERRLEERVRREAPAPDGQPAFEAAAGGASSLDELLAELDRVRAVLRNHSSTALHLPPTPLVDVPELQRKFLDDRTAVLAYFLASPVSYLWVITSSRVAVHRLPPKERIESEARQLYSFLARRDGGAGETAKQRHDRVQQLDRDYWRAASSLGETLLGDAVGGLEATRLVVIADGALHQIPFSALPYPGLDSSEAPVPLVARYEIVRLPSASTLKALDERREARTLPRKKLAVLADPVLDARDPRLGESAREGEDVALPSPVPRSEPGVASLPRVLAAIPVSISTGGPSMSRLLATRQEARSILELVPLSQRFQALGFDASRALVTSGELAEYEVVHFATHGVLNAERPELSGIVLSLFDREGRRQDGFLRLHDIYNLDLPVRLIVLSACGTGLGKAIRGEGLVGLVGGFLSTGSLGVVASYWDVDDEATAELMRRFYSNLFTRGLSPPSALQSAQRSLWQEKRWLSPAFWAAFEFQGDWR
jgi:CHAT domain-containing protein